MNACYGCTERHEGCHGTCESYARYREEIADRKKVMKAYNNAYFWYHKSVAKKRTKNSNNAVKSTMCQLRYH